MSKIELLNEIVANQIAAGEVVDRPQSVVKELIENAQDAGATAIEIWADDGGRSITIIDDGCGMSPEDAVLCFSRYATSKMREIDDLERLNTFGFRGEALASIASVSKVSLITRQAHQPLATKVVVVGGKVLEVGQAGGACGTRIEIRDLFFNVPARKKFLKSDRAELSALESIVQCMALSHPSITFKLRLEDKKSFDLMKVDSTEEIGSPAHVHRAVSILGAETSRYLYAFEDQTHHLQIQGYVVAPLVTRRDYKGIMLYVNGRSVKDRLLVNAVKVAFRSLLEVGRNPICALNFIVDPKSIDVNVHPQKLEVRFSDGPQVCSEIIRSLSRFLASTPWVRREVVEPSPYFVGRGQGEGPSYEIHNPHPNPLPWGEGTTPETLPPPKLNTEMGLNRQQKFSDLKVIGQVGNTFLVLEGQAEMIVVDQHAAHERILFEKFKSRDHATAVQSQALLIPLQLSIKAEEMTMLAEYHHKLLYFGLEIRPFGERNAVVTAIPKDLPAGRAQELVQDILADLLKYGRANAWDEFRNKILASMACHGAIRAGQKLRSEEITALLAQLESIDYAAHCPHGRPLVRAVPMKEMARWFDRP